jgi:hypothetical protein
MFRFEVREYVNEDDAGILKNMHPTWEVAHSEALSIQLGGVSAQIIRIGVGDPDRPMPTQTWNYPAPVKN